MLDRFWKNTAAVLLGLILGVSLSMLLAMWTDAGRIKMGTLMEIVAGGIACIVFVTWMIMGTRPFLIILITAVCIVFIYGGLGFAANSFWSSMEPRPISAPLIYAK